MSNFSSCPIPVQESGPGSQGPSVISPPSSLPNFSSLDAPNSQRIKSMHTTNTITVTIDRENTNNIQKGEAVIIPDVAKVTLTIIPHSCSPDDYGSQTQLYQVGCFTVELVGRSLEDQKKSKKDYTVHIRSIVRNKEQFKAYCVTEDSFSLSKHIQSRLLKLGTVEEINRYGDNVDLEWEVGFVERTLRS